MRKLINIWKITLKFSLNAKRAIHILSVLRKSPALHRIPKGKEQGLLAWLEGWHRDSAQAHQRSSWDLTLHFSSCTLVFCLPVVLENQTQRGGMDRPGCAGNCPIWNLGIKRGRTLCSPLETTPHWEGMWKCCRAGQPFRGLRGTWRNSTRTSAKCCPFQGTLLQQIQLLPAPTASSHQHKSDKKVTAEMRMGFNRHI